MINQEADLCEQIKNVDLECPLKKGVTNITKVIELPSQIPPVSSLELQLNKYGTHIQ